MKNIIISIAAIAATTFANATVRTLNNNNPTPGQYTTYAAAEAASSQNDTIYVSGSPISYGNITVTKYNIMIMGTGHNPQKQNPLVSEIDQISSTAVGQFRVNGIKCYSITLAPTFGAANLVISNSYVYDHIGVESDNFDSYLNLDNNVFEDLVSNQPIRVNIYGNNYLRGQISNNIIKGSLRVRKNGGVVVDGDLDNCNIKNNIFLAGGTTNLFSDINTLNNSEFSNNIILGYSSTGIPASSAHYLNNLVYPTNIFASTGFNVAGTIISNPLFVNYPCPLWNCFFSTSYDYHLSVSSPGHNAGTDGTDIGPYGGPYGATFTTYGEPHIPQMKQMNMPTTVVSGQTFNVNVISTVK